jgi:hypothetical protein
MMRTQAVWAAIVVFGWFAGCGSDPITLEQEPPGDEADAGADADVGGDDVTPEPDVAEEDVEEDVPPVRDCSQHLFGDRNYNCDLLDRCDTENIELRLACCDCDEAFCQPADDCPECAVDGEPPLTTPTRVSRTWTTSSSSTPETSASSRIIGAVV